MYYCKDAEGNILRTVTKKRKTSQWKEIKSSEPGPRVSDSVCIKIEHVDKATLQVSRETIKLVGTAG